MKPQIHVVLLIYLFWMYYNFATIGDKCLFNITDNLLTPTKWSWEPMVLAGAPILFFSIKKLHIEQQIGLKQNIVLLGILLAYLMFLFKMIFSCKQDVYEYLYFTLCMSIAIVLMVELYTNYNTGGSRLAM